MSKQTKKTDKVGVSTAKPARPACIYHWEKYERFVDEHGTIYIRSDLPEYDYKFKPKDSNDWDYATKQQLVSWKIAARPVK